MGPEMLLEEVRIGESEALDHDLLACWRRSVEATHDFLRPEDVDRIGQYVPDAMRAVSHLAICRTGDGRLAGFCGVEGETVEMLFVDPDARGEGIGTALLDYAVEDLGALTLDVNEQNAQAAGFYLHYGFQVVGRSETDGMGDPFPLLHMRLGS